MRDLLEKRSVTVHVTVRKNKLQVSFHFPVKILFLIAKKILDSSNPSYCFLQFHSHRTWNLVLLSVLLVRQWVSARFRFRETFIFRGQREGEWQVWNKWRIFCPSTFICVHCSLRVSSRARDLFNSREWLKFFFWDQQAPDFLTTFPLCGLLTRVF